MSYFKLLELKVHHAARDLLSNAETLKCGCCITSHKQTRPNWPVA